MTKAKYWQNHLASRYQEVYDQNHDSWFNEELVNQLNECSNNLNSADQEYKKNHNKFQYGLLKYLGLPLSFLLIVPAYWAVKKYKALRDNKNQLLQVIDEAKTAKLAVHREIMNQLPYDKIHKEFQDIISYQPMGLISHGLLQELQANSLFDFSGLDINLNTYNSNWAILDHDKIVINVAQQNHHKYMKMYTGSTSVPYTDKDGNAKSATVTATYNHPAYEIFANNKSYFFMQSCSNLEFEFAGKSNSFKSKLYNKSNKFASLENNEFEKSFKWARNDDLQFRMIFTPYTQEQYLENVNKKDVASQYRWEKIGPFLGSQWVSNVHFGHEEDYLYNYYKFSSDAYQTLEQLKLDVFNNLQDYYYDIFKNFNYYWLTTILKSEDHSSMIHDAYNGDVVIDDRLSLHLFFHYVLVDILEQNIISRPNIATFNKFMYPFTEIMSGVSSPYPVYATTMEGLTYDLIPKVHYESVYCSEARRYVQVAIPYTDYIPQTDQLKIVATYLPTKYYYRNRYGRRETNIKNQAIIDLIVNNFAGCRVRIDHEILAISTSRYDSIPLDDLQYLIALLLEE